MRIHFDKYILTEIFANILIINNPEIYKKNILNLSSHIDAEYLTANPHLSYLPTATVPKALANYSFDLISFCAGFLSHEFHKLY